MSGSIRDTFFEECEELLEALVEGLATLEQADADPETVNAVFRAVHSIKGGAGAFGLDPLVGFAHKFETVLDRIRDQHLEIDDTLMRLLHRAGDVLADHVEAARDGIEPNDDAHGPVLRELDGYLDAEEEEAFSFDAVSIGFDAAPIDAQADRTEYAIRFSPQPALFANGHEPLLLFDALAELGEIEVSLDIDAIPEFTSSASADPTLDWTITLRSCETETDVQAIFEFVDSLCRLEITSLPIGTTSPSVPHLPDPQTAAGPAEGPSAATPGACEGDAPAKSREIRGPKPTLRVDLERVDRLINTVGELIINQAMISQRIEELGLPAAHQVFNDLEDYGMLARDIQEGVMAIRAQPVKPLFQRMSRIVREASQATGKQARLVTEGDNTEVDKTVIERLADPLTHMIRNAVDHGLEDPARRVEAGKDPTGTIRLSASHRSGSVVIQVADDGAGLDRERILAKARNKGLVSSEADLADQEIDNLLFLPGFSTAAEVSNLSGRGVGMDVVKNAVTALGGRIAIDSTYGGGTVFTISLPLTLAVMDGFVVTVAGQTMVVPITSILETIRPTADDLHRLGPDGEVIAVRGNYVPVVDVAASLGLSPAGDCPDPAILLLVASERHGLTALRVDAIHDQRQVVIKSLESNFCAIRGVSAATILGDGKIALILDTDILAEPQSAVRETPSNPEPVSRRELRHA
ncbi:chemotaxis protein CheA [Thalassococcus sp. CAU 1522]|uniref:Chemotaxis protein CheA n=1 Tax=Thalassococcus arenae TaxID=2851652 RepID=A0ABS6N3K9_9RHOB|nr:chemotaxis protein CheA [Thalassococcus arenae]MBV2358609.1 chemotaxis protein CheA [Thalassococcus arenae]